MKVGLAGAGYIINIHARAAQGVEGVELAAVAEKYADKRAELAKKFDIKGQYETVDEMLRKSGVDALVIGTPNALHAPQAITALKAGVHVLVEKPMALDAREGEKMEEASVRSGAALMVAHCWRFDEDVLWLKKHVGGLGKIIRTKGYGVHANWGPVGWFTQQALAGGGALADMGIHALDTARFLLGDPQPVSVYARIGTHYKDFDVDDTGVLLVNWEGGAVSYIESGWWQPHTDGPEAATQLYGTQGFGQLFPTLLELPNPKKNKVEMVHSGYKFPRQEHCPQSMYNAQMAYFVGCIREKRLPVPGAEEGLVNMRVVEAAYKSARTGRAEKVKG